MCYIFLPLDLDLNMNTTNRLMWVTCVGLSLIVSVSSRSVTLLFDPPTPKPGIITISCQFELAAGDTLNSLYFNKISDSRFFRYTVGSEPIIADKFKDKVLDYKTDNATYMDLTFVLSACDVAQYECNVLPSPSNVDITDQKNLDVINDIPPKLKINGELLPNGTVYVGVGVVVVTCELRNAGPPLPETLYLLQDGAAVATNSSFVQNTTTCTWDLPVLTLDVNVSAEDFPKNGRLYHCDVYYRALRNESSNIVRIVVNETVVEGPGGSEGSDGHNSEMIIGTAVACGAVAVGFCCIVGCCCVMKKKKREQNSNHGNGVPLDPKAGVDNPGCQNSQHHYNGYEPQDEKTMPASQQPASIQRENSDSESSRKFKNRVTPDKEDLTLTERHHHPPSQDFRDEPEMSPSPKRKKKKKSRKHRNAPEGEVGRADIDHPHRPLPVPAHKKLPPLKRSDPRAGNYHNNAYEWRDEEGEC